MSSQTDGSMLASSNSGMSQPVTVSHQPARASRLSRRTMASDADFHPASDTARINAQQTLTSSPGRATRHSTRSHASTDLPADASPAADSEQDNGNFAPSGHGATTDGAAAADVEADAEAAAETAPEMGLDAELNPEPAPAPEPECPAIPAVVPEQVELIRQADKPPVMAPADAIGDAMAAYNILRAFSWQIRLSPFAFEELCAALFLPTPSPLMDELHVCLIRSLAFDENKAERAERALELSLLDAVSWPEFVWEYLYMRHDDLRHHRWTQRNQSSPSKGSPKTAQPSPAQAQESKAESTAAFKENLSDQGNKTSIAVTGRSPTKPKKALTNGAVLDQPRANGHSAVQQLAQDSGGAMLLKRMMQRKPFESRTQLEYYGLPPGIKAAILVSLVNDLLDISSIRHEIDKREAAGQWVAGKGGAGGSFPMRSDEERAKRAEAGSDAEGNDDDDYKDEDDEEGPSQKAEVIFEGDGNTDLCVLCGLGGSLLCCDGCPAAYHMRCIGETAKSIPEGEWLCPECAVGGRGETAGLRVPRAGLNPHKQPLWMCHGCLFRSARPELSDIGGEAREDGPAPMDRWNGEVAAVEAKAVRKIRGEEKPHPASILSLREPPEVHWVPGLSAEGYVNRYRNSWTAAVAATKTFVEDMSRRRGRPPAGAPRVSLSMAELPVPVPLSRFQWPSSAGKGQRGNLVRCGQCHMCRNPLMKKPCLHPIVPRGLDGSDEGTSAPKLMTLANYAMKLEREVWGALGGPWGSDTWMSWRRDWAQKVRTATTAEPVAQAILELVTQLQPRVLNSRWAIQPLHRFTRALPRRGPGGAAPRVSPQPSLEPKATAKQKSAAKPVKAVTKVASKSGRLNRSSSAATDVPSSGRRRNYKEESDSAPSESDEEEAQDPFAADDLNDPTIVDSTGQANRAGWALNQRSRWEGDLQGVPKLPRQLAKQLGRRGGTVRVTGVKYNTKQLVVQARLAWIGAMQAVKTAPELALQLRKLDSNTQWEALKRPLGEEFPFASAEISDRRPAALPADDAAAATTASATALATLGPSNPSWEYLLQLSHSDALLMESSTALHAQQPPLQPLSQPAGQLQQPQGLLLQPQSAAGQLASATFTHHTQQNGTTTVVNAEHQQPEQMSMLPNQAVAQQHQQTDGSPVDKQIAVQVAMSIAPLAELPEQAQMAAQAAGMTDSAAAQSTAAQAAPENHASIAAAGTQHAQHSGQNHATSQPEPNVDGPSSTLLVPNGIPGHSSSLATLLPAVQQRFHSAGAIATDRAGQLALFQPQGFGNSPALGSREGTPAVKPQPMWVQEDKLPLWLVKAFEEKRRRDVSMVAARAAQQAQRDVNAANRASGSSSFSYTPSMTLKTKRQEAKAAAEAAAAAAADACAVCGLLYGDDAVKDDFWIACDKCNRWYHGVCVELTQEKADAMEEAKWDCPECTTLKNERRRLAVDRARQRRAAQGKALMREPSESDPGSEDAFGVSKREAKKGRRLAATSKKSKKRKATEDPVIGLGLEEEGQAAEAQELYCLCRQPNDPTRDYIECTDCAQWYHPECVGASIEEVEASDKYTCPLCTRALQKEERKRQRQAEAAATAELEREAREAQAARRAKLAELDMTDWPRNWQAAVQRVLENVLKLPEALPFAEPVPLDEVLGYRELVPNPMDLGTVLGRSKADHYDTPLEALADVRQVWANCRIYNADGSQIWQVCADAEAAFDLGWSSARLPLPRAPPLPPQPSPTRRQSKAEPSSNGLQAPRVKIKLTVKPGNKQAQQEEPLEDSGSDAEISDSDEPESPAAASKKRGAKRKAQEALDQAEPSSAAQLKLAQKVVKGLTKLQSAEPFLSPVSEEDAPGYHSIVNEPMDLGTVLGKLKSGAYTSLGAVLHDVDLVWANCRAFNEPDSEICALADEAQQALRIRWQQAGLPTVTPAGPSKPPSAKKSKGKKRQLEDTLPADSDQAGDRTGDESAPQKKKKQKGLKQGADAAQPEPSSAEELKRALKAVKGVLKLKVAAPFSAPVSEEDVPGYHDVVAEPMDLQTIADKLQQHQYTSVGEVYSNVELVWANCRAFNEPDSDICEQAGDAETAFKTKWQQQDLPIQDTQPAKKKSKGKSAKLQAEDTSTARGKKGQPEAAAAADDSASNRKQKKGASKLEAEGQQHSKGKPSRDGAATAEPDRQRKRGAVADATDDDEPDAQPSNATGAKSPPKGQGKKRKADAAVKSEQSPKPSTSLAKAPDRGKKKKDGKVGSPSEEAAALSKRQKRNNAEAGDGQKKSKAKDEDPPDAKQHNKALQKTGGEKKLTASERLRQGLPPTPGSRASSRRGDA